MIIKPYYQDKYCTIYHGDCVDVLPQLAPVDLVLTDPPYGIGGNKLKLGNAKKIFFRGGTWDNIVPLGAIAKLPSLGECIIWGGNYFTGVLPATNDWLIWHKKNDGLPFSECEVAWTNLGCQMRHISHHWSGEEKLHPTAKPLVVINWAMSKSKTTGTILDPYMGSGTTLVAAKDRGRKAIGIEISKEYCDIAVKRLRQETLF